jgi:basic membrane protein A
VLLIAAACGDTAETTTTAATATSEAQATTTTAGETTTTAAAETTTTAAAATTTTAASVEFDANGDGVVIIGIAAAGPRDDDGYYQAVVDGATEFAASQGWGEPIVVDNITAEDAASELESLVQQGVDIMVVGASEIAAPMADLSEQYAEVFWYCNCGAGWPESPFYAQSLDDGSEIHYTAGVAAGAMLQDIGGDSVAMIGCCDLGFEKETFLAMQMGLASVDESFTITYIPTGAFPFDFENVAGATEAFNNAAAEGADIIYPYLGGAAEPVALAANEAGLLTIAPGPSDACEKENVTWDMTAKFDGGDYVRAIFPLIVSGEVVEGQIKVFRVGIDPEPGALICNPSAEAAALLDAAYVLVASGDLAGEFGAIKGEAYAG